MEKADSRRSKSAPLRNPFWIHYNTSLYPLLTYLTIIICPILIPFSQYIPVLSHDYYTH